MAKRLSLTLTDDLNDFVQANSGDGSEFINDTEFVRHCVREKKRQLVTKATDESYRFHMVVLENLEDAIEGKNFTTMDEMEKKLLADL